MSIRKIFIALYIFFCFVIICPAQTGHWEQLYPKNNPGARASHGMAPIGTNQVLLFGGSNGNMLNDTWLFDLNKKDWEKIECKNSPNPRMELGLVQISKNQALLFGGFDYYKNKYYNDIWIFNLDSLNWINIQQENPPLERKNHGIASLNDNEVLIFGGEYPGGERISETLIYKIKENEWENQYFAIDPNYRRTLPNIAKIGDGLIYLYGGRHLITYNDNWIFDRKTNTWNEIKDMKDTIFLPIYICAFVEINKGNALLFGGHAVGDTTNNSWYDGTWLFNYYIKKWINLNLENHPSGRIYHKLAKIDSNKIIYFGGDAESGKNPDDTWLFTLDTGYTSIQEEKPNKQLLSINQISINEILIEYDINETYERILELYDIMGNLILRKEGYPNYYGINQEIINIDNINSGIYFLRIYTKNKVLIEKFSYLK